MAAAQRRPHCRRSKDSQPRRLLGCAAWAGPLGLLAALMQVIYSYTLICFLNTRSANVHDVGGKTIPAADHWFTSFSCYVTLYLHGSAHNHLWCSHRALHSGLRLACMIAVGQVQSDPESCRSAFFMLDAGGHESSTLIYNQLRTCTYLACMHGTVCGSSKICWS